MQRFGSSSVFVWSKLRHWFGTVWWRFGGVWAKFAMPLVVRGGTASFRAPDLVLELRRSRRGLKNCDGAAFRPGSGGGVVLVTSDASTAPADDWQLCGTECNTGVAGGQGSQGAGHILAPERTNRNTWTELRVFQKRARGYISYTSFLFSFFFSSHFVWRFWSCLWKKKVLLRYQYIEETLVFHFFFFP